MDYKERQNQYRHNKRMEREAQLRDYLGNQCSVCESKTEQLYIVRVKPFKHYNSIRGISNYFLAGKLTFGIEMDCFKLFCKEDLPENCTIVDNRVVIYKIQPIRIDGVRYKSIAEASRILHISQHRVRTLGEPCE